MHVLGSPGARCQHCNAKHGTCNVRAYACEQVFASVGCVSGHALAGRVCCYTRIRCVCVCLCARPCAYVFPELACVLLSVARLHACSSACLSVCVPVPSLYLSFCLPLLSLLLSPSLFCLCLSLLSLCCLSLSLSLPRVPLCLSLSLSLPLQSLSLASASASVSLLSIYLSVQHLAHLISPKNGGRGPATTPRHTSPRRRCCRRRFRPRAS